MIEDENKKYKFITLTLTAIYCCIFIKSIIDGRFIESNEAYEKVFSISSLILATFLFLLFVGLINLINHAFRKLQLLLPYIIFAIISSAMMITLPFSNGGGVWSLSFEWYFLMEFQIGFFMLLLFIGILVISLVIKLCLKKFENQN